MVAFIETADTAAWRPGEAKPLAVLIMMGAPKLKDVAIFAQALRPGQTLRVVGDDLEMRAALEPFCAAHGLAITYVTEDRVLTCSVCYTHYYFDIQLAPTALGLVNYPAREAI